MTAPRWCPPLVKLGRRIRPDRPACVFALMLAVLATVPLQAQMVLAPVPVGEEPATQVEGWRERVSISARYAEFRPDGRSELFSLLDEALTPSSRALRPQLLGGAVHVRVGETWGVLLGAETGGRTVATTSRVTPVSSADDGPISQRTRLDFTSVYHLGGEWHPLRLRSRHREDSDRLRLVLGAGAGTTRYALRQWGSFVDVEQEIAFEAELRSEGRGTFGYATAGAERPFGRWVALQLHVRRQFGSARMAADYSTFDRLDLSGTSVSAGLRFHPAGSIGRR